MGLLHLKVPNFILSVRIWLIRLINRLSQSTGVFIPTLSLLSHFFSPKYFYSDYKLKASSMFFKKVSKTSINNLKHIFLREELFNQILEEVSKSIILFAYHVSFPELCSTSQIRLEKFTNESTSIKKIKASIYCYMLSH